MPQYTVQLEGGGEMRVNASSPEAARNNVSAQGGTPAGSTSGGGGTGGTSGGGATVYNTVNGPRTADQMAAELTAVGWGGGEDPVTAYARTTGGAVTAGGGGGGSAPISATAADGQSLGGQSPQTQADYAAVYGPAAAQQWVIDHNAAIGAPAGGVPSANATTAAKTTAGAPSTPTTPPQPASNTTYANLEAARLKFDAANLAATQAYNQSRLNLDSEDLAFRKAQQAFAESLSRAQMTGTFEGQLTLPALMGWAQAFGTYGQPATGQQTLAAQQQFWSQAFQQAQANQKSVQDYLQLLSTLRGPQDYGQYLRTMASTPQGLQSLVQAAGAAGGRVPGFGTTGAGTTPATLGGLMGQAGSGGTAPGGTSYADYMTAAQGLPAPSQINPQNWNAMTDVQRQLLLGMYEQSGWNVNDALQQYKASLPRFGSTTPQVGTTRLV